MRPYLTNTLSLTMLLACQSAGQGRNEYPTEGDPEAGKQRAADELLISRSETLDSSPELVAVSGSYPLGRLQDDVIEKLLYEALKLRVNGSKDGSPGITEVRELGEQKSFEFSIVKSMRDGLETEGQERPNQLEVEVRGWFRRDRGHGKAPESTPSCASFDTVATVIHSNGQWILGENQQFVFTREDEEDCY